jgi:hypothetical protein
MGLLFLVVVDAHEEHFSSIVRHLDWILFAEYLADGRIGILIVF